MKTLSESYKGKTVYYIIDKTESLALSLREMKLYVWNNLDKTGTDKHLPFLYKNSFSEAKKLAKSCGMDVVTYSEDNGENRLYVS